MVWILRFWSCLALALALPPRLGALVLYSNAIPVVMIAATSFRALSGQGTRQAFDPYPQRAMPRRDALSGRRCSQQQQLAASDGSRVRHISPLDDRATMNEAALIMF
jgi:hypothetical protein